MTYSIGTQPAVRTLGAVDQVEDAVLSTPPAGCVGVTSLKYRATDATFAATVCVADG